MRPICLTLKGFAGIMSGQGKNELVVDLEKSVPADVQIIAIAGPNGAGKTTIMDNLHPYRLMPSRAGAPTPGAFSFYDHIVGGEGCKDLVWEFMGVRYQSVLRFRATAKTKRTEAYLYVVGEDGRSTPWLDAKTGAVSDGKTDTYDRAIELILGKPEVFFQAQFSAQGKAPMGSMTAGEVKRLIADMIGAAKAAELSAKAADVLKSLRPRLTAAQDELNRTQEQAPDHEHLAARAEKAQQDQRETTKRLAELKFIAASLAVQIAHAKGSMEQRKATQAQHDAFAAQLAQAMTAGSEALQANEMARSAATASCRERVKQAAQGVESSSRLVTALQGDVTRLEAVIATEPALFAAQASAADLEGQLVHHQKVVDDLAPKVMLLEQVRTGLATIAENLAGAKKEGEHMAAALETAKATAELLERVPCKGTDFSGRCMLLAQANNAASQVPEMVVKLASARQGYGEQVSRRKTIQEELSALIEAKAVSDASVGVITQLRVDFKAVESVLINAPLVAAAKQEVVLVRGKFLQAQDDAVAATQALQSASAELEGLTTRFNALEEGLKAIHAERLAALEQTRKALPPLEQSADVDALMASEERNASRIKALESELVVHQQTTASVAAQFELLAQVNVQIHEGQVRVDKLAAEISKWVLLTKALGTDGIVAMSIEDAGPTIAGIANALLDDCYGGRFALSLVTQQDTQAGITKETFKIQVEDNHRGESKRLDDMSGGEKVWINECLVRAMALYMAQVEDVRSQTLFSDESDGPLDPQRKRQYMAMKRAVIERGGYEREYLITQTPELLEMCDAVVDVRNL